MLLRKFSYLHSPHSQNSEPSSKKRVAVGETFHLTYFLLGHISQLFSSLEEQPKNIRNKMENSLYSPSHPMLSLFYRKNHCYLSQTDLVGLHNFLHDHQETEVWEYALWDFCCLSEEMVCGSAQIKKFRSAQQP